MSISGVNKYNYKAVAAALLRRVSQYSFAAVEAVMLILSSVSLHLPLSRFSLLFSNVLEGESVDSKSLSHFVFHHNFTIQL